MGCRSLRNGADWARSRRGCTDEIAAVHSGPTVHRTEFARTGQTRGADGCVRRPHAAMVRIRPGTVPARGLHAATRLMHVGFDVYVAGEVTAPSISEGDRLLMLSASGETPVSLHLARRAADLGARVVTITTREDSSLAAIADVVVAVPIDGSRQSGGSLRTSFVGSARCADHRPHARRRRRVRSCGDETRTSSDCGPERRYYRCVIT